MWTWSPEEGWFIRVRVFGEGAVLLFRRRRVCKGLKCVCSDDLVSACQSPCSALRFLAEVRVPRRYSYACSGCRDLF